MKRETVVGALVERLRLDPQKKKKVSRYYHELEAGLLEPERVDRRVWDVLAESLGVRVADLLAWRPRALEFPAPAYLRADVALPKASPPSAPAEPEDEIDRLFAG